MKKYFILLLIIAFAPIVVNAADDDDRFGTWTEIGISKSLPHDFSVGVNAEIRAEEEPRLGIGASLEYKPIKYLKFGVGYSFISRYKDEKRREHYRNDIEDEDHWDGYNLRDSYWSPRHRVSLDVTGTVKLWKWLRISLRERYRITRYSPVEVNDSKFRYSKLYNGQGEFQGYELDEHRIEVDTREDKNRNVLRSRLKLEVDKKGWKLSPFVSCELYNNLNLGNKMTIEKVRNSVGLEYKVNKKHRVTLAYILNCDIHDDEGDLERIYGRIHALNIGYDFKF